MGSGYCYGCMEQITAYPCHKCGYSPANAVAPYVLQPGTILKGKYLVGKVLGQGGFGITYIGVDLLLRRKVAIKEYYPSGFVGRMNGSSQVIWYTGEAAHEARQAGQEMVLKEARKMSKVSDVGAVVKVFDIFQENGTAYICMDYVEGKTLQEWLKKTGPLSWDKTKAIFIPVISAMEQVHQRGLVHRDLSPDNLMIQPDGTVKILDLGAAKDLNINSGKSSMQVAKNGFSPLEQYINAGNSGSWTDVYAMAATIYYTLTGILPPTAIDRLDNDRIRWDLPQLAALPREVLTALKRAMAVRSGERTQTMEVFLQELLTPARTKHKKRKWQLPASIAAAVALVGLVFGLAFGGTGSEDNRAHEANKPAPDAPATEAAVEAEPVDPVQFTIYYLDSSSVPFKADWLALQETAKLANAEVTVEAIPEGEYSTPVNQALETGENCPDVIMFYELFGSRTLLCMNGGAVPISNYSEWSPNFNAMVEKLGLTDQVNNLKLADGNRYILPALHESTEYSGGLILRADFLEEKGFEDPKTFDDLYQILKAYKEENPDSYPMVHYLASYITHRMIMPAWGCAVGYNVPPYLGPIAWDYENQVYYNTGTSDAYREYLQYMNKLASEGLLDPEASAEDVWSAKMTSGKAICTYAYYDQIASLEAASEIEGFDLKLYLPLEGPAGALGENRGQAYRGLLFPAAVAERDDFEQVVRAVDKMFYSEEAARIWSIGVEGVTYNMVNGEIQFVDEVKNAPEGIDRYLQSNYGCGTSGFQSVWLDEYIVPKMEPEYAQIYTAAAEMGANQPYAPEPRFDEFELEESYMYWFGTLTNSCEQFIYGELDINDDAAWAAYCDQLMAEGLQEYLDLHNENRNLG